MKRYLAEFLGTFVLVFGGCGAAIIGGSRIGPLGIALAFGLSLLAMVYTIGPISGCHVNPAVTLGLLLSGKFEAKHLPGYVIAQIGGAIAATAMLVYVLEGRREGFNPATGLAANGFAVHSAGGYDLIAAFTIEIVLTFFLVFTVLGTTDTKAPVGFAGLAIGLVLTLDHLLGIPVTGTSVNPARSIGPALFVGGWALKQLWVFLVAPPIGAVVAAIAYRIIRTDDPVITARVAESALKSEQKERAT
jgi:aquaporin Z